LSLALSCSAASASTQSFAGVFEVDDDLFSTSFTLTEDSLFKATTLSFGGGVDGNGQAVAAGSFAPVLSLFLQGAGLVQLAHGSSSVCGAGSGNPDPASGFCWDALMDTTLTAGLYTLVLSQDGNDPLGPDLLDGYTRAGQHDYTGLDYLGAAGLSFIQVDGTQRTGHWAFDIQTNAIPEPTGALLALLGLAALAATRRPGTKGVQA
jgi:hypothetical protein